MKKIVMIITFIAVLISSNISYADTQDELLKSQQDSLNISSFLKEVEKYTNSIYEDINVKDMFNLALTGKIDNEKLFKSILNILGKEVIGSVKILGSIIVIIKHKRRTRK